MQMATRKFLEGSSTIDGNICFLGTENDYSRDEGGTYKNVSHYFKSSNIQGEKICFRRTQMTIHTVSTVGR